MIKSQSLVHLIICSILPLLGYTQAPNMGTAVNFALFSSDGSVSNNGISHITGDVGTNNGSSTAFGNINGVMHDGDAESAQCAVDLLVAYNQLNSAVPTAFPAPALGNGQTLTPGIYSIPSAATLNLELTLNALGDSNAVFIFKIQGPLSASSGSKVTLANSAMACNVFWKVEGLVDIATGANMKGSIVANNAAINFNSGCQLIGRALSTTGAITIDGTKVNTPIGCGSPVLTGPNPPNLGLSACYAIFSADGAVTNSGITYATGDVGTNVGSTTGFNPANVTGTIHQIPDGSTAQCASDLLGAYDDLNNLTHEIELLYPAQFGNSLTLTPHTYLMNAAAYLNDTVFLNAQGNPNAVFVIQINGALTTSTYAQVELINGTLPENVFWKIEGAVTINDFSSFKGTLVCNNGALGSLSNGSTFDGRVLTTSGALNTFSTTVDSPFIPSNCASVGIVSDDSDQPAIMLYPNPFSTTLNFTDHVAITDATEIRLYDVLGSEVRVFPISQDQTSVNTDYLAPGIYFYKIVSSQRTIQSGTIVSKQ